MSKKPRIKNCMLDAIIGLEISLSFVVKGPHEACAKKSTE